MIEKLHVILFSKSSLGKITEQAHEAIHYEFFQYWSKYSIKDVKREQYGINLIKATVDINGNHL